MLSKEKIVGAILEAGIGIDFDSEMLTDQKFEDMGMDSLDVFNIFIALEAITGHMVPDSEIESLQTVDDIQKYFESIKT